MSNPYPVGTRLPICESCEQAFEPIAKGYDSHCQECCDHEFDPDEGYHCLNCGKDGAEDVLSAAYDRAKDIRKYGL